MELKKGTILQGGKYEIIRSLGQGGFGITYLAEQVSLGRKVAIKEFFMKEYCERDGSTSRVSVPSSGSRELVEMFYQKYNSHVKKIVVECVYDSIVFDSQKDLYVLMKENKRRYLTKDGFFRYQ